MKKIIIIVMLFMLTGCASATYNLNIEKDLTVNEEINITGTKEYFNNYYMNLPITIVKQNYNSTWLDPVKNNNYQYELREDNLPYPSVFISKKYNSLDNYQNGTIFKKQIFEDINITYNNNLITLQTNGFYKYTPDDSDGEVDRFAISNLSINIKIPYVVTNNNADKYDARTNTYIWYINENTDNKEIKLTFDKTKIYIYNLVLYISIGIVIILFIIGIIYILKIKNKNQKVNRI